MTDSKFYLANSNYTDNQGKRHYEYIVLAKSFLTIYEYLEEKYESDLSCLFTIVKEGRKWVIDFSHSFYVDIDTISLKHNSTFLYKPFAVTTFSTRKEALAYLELWWKETYEANLPKPNPTNDWESKKVSCYFDSDDTCISIGEKTFKGYGYRYTFILPSTYEPVGLPFSEILTAHTHHTNSLRELFARLSVNLGIDTDTMASVMTYKMYQNAN